MLSEIVRKKRYKLQIILSVFARLNIQMCVLLETVSRNEITAGNVMFLYNYNEINVYNN